MHTLTQKRNSNELINLFRKAPKAQPTFRYLSDAEYQQHMDKIADYNFATRVDAYGKQACLQLAKGFTFVIPYLDRYVLDMKRCLITDEDLKRHYKDAWEELPSEHRKKIQKERDKHNLKVEKGLRQLQDFADHQSRHLGQMGEEHQETLLDFEETEVEVHIANDLRTYIAPAPKEAQYLLSCKQIAVNLALYSKGALYLTPLEVEKELVRRGFEKSKLGFYVKIK